MIRIAILIEHLQVSSRKITILYEHLYYKMYLFELLE